MPGKTIHPRSRLARLLEEKMSASRIREAAARELEEHAQRTPTGSLLRQVILGGQDGLVNVLGLVLGVAGATSNAGLVIVSGLAGTFAESISMAAVAYSSSRAMQDHYRSEVEREKWELENLPEVEKEEVRLIYMKKGFRGKTLEDVVKKITSRKDTWLEAMMADELGLGAELKKISPPREAAVVGFSSVAGSVIPIVPFLFLPVWSGVLASVAISAVILFIAGMVKARLTVGKPLKSGAEMALVGMAAAIAGYAIGTLVAGLLGLRAPLV